MDTLKSYEELNREIRELTIKLEEANDTVEAIRTGQVDAIVVHGPEGHRLYSLKTADHTYRVFIEKMSEGAVTIDKARTIIYSNSRFADMVNLPLEKVIGVSFDTFVPEESFGDYRALLADGWIADVKMELNLQKSDGTPTACLFSCNVLELDDEVTALSVIITDLTRQKEIQQQLKTQNRELEAAREMTTQLNDQLEATVKERTEDLSISREHFKILSDNITQMTWTNTPEGNINYFNQRWYQYTGLTFEQTKDWGWKAIVHPDDLEETMSKYRASLESGNILELENRLRGADGTYRWFLNRSMPLRNERGEIVYWIGTATDIDERKRELERKDEFIGVASHELKTPLTSLKGYLQLMKLQMKDKLPPVFSTYLAKANVVADKLQHLVDDLLDVSKINAGRLEYMMDTIDLKTLVDSCVESSKLVYSGFDFETRNEETYIVKANAERLEQVMANIINNAVKYSGGNKRVIVETKKYGDRVRVSITDLGIGLDEDQKKRIFERFYRGDDKKYSINGLGMGLYICSQIIDTHGGVIGVESQPRKGSTFYFELPLEK